MGAALASTNNKRPVSTVRQNLRDTADAAFQKSEASSGRMG
ncbi:hypothetical protein RMSM_01373 [Rhodopirellula maiorica SM1]|uniref:Uncharacterized protein n=1 Tax=Rhodopirellula maiorica SM1 TaxID=1265738 RepID=M5S680_9BACT|nr:hypothetical protein RMSM_01373 [Rhodopirellula maiorica SM1]